MAQTRNPASRASANVVVESRPPLSSTTAERGFIVTYRNGSGVNRVLRDPDRHRHESIDGPRRPTATTIICSFPSSAAWERISSKLCFTESPSDLPRVGLASAVVGEPRLHLSFALAVALPPCDTLGSYRGSTRTEKGASFVPNRKFGLKPKHESERIFSLTLRATNDFG